MVIATFIIIASNWKLLTNCGRHTVECYSTTLDTKTNYWCTTTRVNLKKNSMEQNKPGIKNTLYDSIQNEVQEQEKIAYDARNQRSNWFLEGGEWQRNGMERGMCGLQKRFFDLGIDHMHFPIFSYILLICAFDCIHLMLQQILLAQG